MPRILTALDETDVCELTGEHYWELDPSIPGDARCAACGTLYGEEDMPLSTKDLTPDPEPGPGPAGLDISGPEREELTCRQCGLVYTEEKRAESEISDVIPPWTVLSGCPRCGLLPEAATEPAAE